MRQGLIVCASVRSGRTDLPPGSLAGPARSGLFRGPEPESREGLSPFLRGGGPASPSKTPRQKTTPKWG